MLQFLPMLLGLVKSGSEAVSKVQDAKTDLAVAKLNAKARQAELERETRLSSWIDEYLVFMITLPAFLSFVPYFRPHIQAGFEALNAMPEWYQYLLWTAVGVGLGVKGIGAGIKGTKSVLQRGV